MQISMRGHDEQSCFARLMSAGSGENQSSTGLVSQGSTPCSLCNTPVIPLQVIAHDVREQAVHVVVLEHAEQGDARGRA